MRFVFAAFTASYISLTKILHVQGYSTDRGTSTSTNRIILNKSTTVNKLKTPVRELRPPFPDGLNGGKVVTLPSSLHYDRQGSGLLLPSRDVTVWTPPDYDKYPDMRFPVLYVHDGQNAMMDENSWTGSSWRLAGALTRLSERKVLQTTETHSPPIVVMMPCAEDRLAIFPRRHLEYGDISQPFAQTHADFVGNILKPLIDSRFRTMPEKENTCVMGSSLGGQASLHLLLRHPDSFGKAACMSPCFLESLFTAVSMSPDLKDKKIYIDNGGDVEDVKVPLVDPFDHLTSKHWWNPGYFWLDNSLQPGIDRMISVLDMKGIDYEYVKEAGGRHNERAWASRIHKPLLSLYGPDRPSDGL